LKSAVGIWLLVFEIVTALTALANCQLPCTETPFCTKNLSGLHKNSGGPVIPAFGATQAH